MNKCLFDDFLSFNNSTFTDLKSQENVCRLAKTILDRGGDHELADIHHLMEMRARRKQIAWKIKCKYLKNTQFYHFVNCLCRFPEWLVMDFISQYGTKFKRLLCAWGGLIFGCSGLYWFCDGIEGALSKCKTWSYWLECLYFSVVTATTLGYGDLQPDPVGWGRLIAASEAMLGMLFWTLLLVVIARKYMRS